MLTLLDLLHGFRSWADRPAIVYRTGVRRFEISYETLYDLSLRMSGLLDRQRIGPGDRVLVWAPNSPWWAVTFWGCVARKAVVVPVDFLSDRERAATIARLTGARLVVQSRDKADRITDLPSLFVDDLTFLLEDAEPLASYPAIDPRETAEIIYTSGTTGTPKGVVLTHRNLVANLVQVNERIPIVDPDYVFLSLLPLSHMFEQMGGFLTPFFNGASVVYPRTLKPSAILDAFHEEDIHAAICVPRLLQLLRSGIEREVETMRMTGVFPRLLRVGARLPFDFRKWLFFPV